MDTVVIPKKPYAVIEDKQGNRLIRKKTTMHLALKGAKSLREIGRINFNARTMSTYRSRTKHLHRQSNSYGFNHYLIKNAVTFDSVLLKDEYGMYRISCEVILKDGFFLYFKQEGFELQIFLSLDTINKYKI